MHDAFIIKEMIAKTSTAPVIQLKGLTKRYGIGDTARDVLDSVNLKIEQGFEWHIGGAVVGCAAGASAGDANRYRLSKF